MLGTTGPLPQFGHLELETNVGQDVRPALLHARKIMKHVCQVWCQKDVFEGPRPGHLSLIRASHLDKGRHLKRVFLARSGKGAPITCGLRPMTR